MWLQKEIRLHPRPRGFHLITDEILSAVPEVLSIHIGLMHLLLKHTSAALTLNENADPSVRLDLENYFNRTVPENASYYLHRDEGPDDLPAHIKSSLLGASLMLPISKGRLNLGVWQGIYLCEHRNQGGHRSLVITVQGEEAGSFQP